VLARNNLFAFASEDPTAFGLRIAAAAKEHPVYFDEGVDMPVVLRSSDVIAALKNPATFSTRAFDIGLMKGALIALEGEAHARMRRLYNSFFSPRALARYESMVVRPIARRVVDRMADKPGVDLIDAFATAMPIEVISTLFGLPADSITANDAHVRTMLASIVRPLDPALAEAGRRAYDAMAEQLREIAAREIERPSDNLLGEVARALIAEGMGTVDECERVVFTLILGSYETTIWMLTDVLAALLAHPEAMARLRADSSLVPSAIEEAIRWCSSATGTVRFVEREATIAGHTFSAGTVLFLSLTSLHYDESLYPRPEVFELGRRPTTLLFGLGAHYCVGAPLARMEARIGLSLLLERFPALRADPVERPVFQMAPRGATAFGPERLPALLA
jgi:cytochrome P450